MLGFLHSLPWQLCRCPKLNVSALGRTAASAETLGLEDLGSALNGAFPQILAVRSCSRKIAVFWFNFCFSLLFWEQMVLSFTVLPQLIKLAGLSLSWLCKLIHLALDHTSSAAGLFLPVGSY